MNPRLIYILISTALTVSCSTLNSSKMCEGEYRFSSAANYFINYETELIPAKTSLAKLTREVSDNFNIDSIKVIDTMKIRDYFFPEKNFSYACNLLLRKTKHTVLVQSNYNTYPYQISNNDEILIHYPSSYFPFSSTLTFFPNTLDDLLPEEYENYFNRYIWNRYFYMPSIFEFVLNEDEVVDANHLMSINKDISREIRNKITKQKLAFEIYSKYFHLLLYSKFKNPTFTTYRSGIANDELFFSCESRNYKIEFNKVYPFCYTLKPSKS